MSQLAKHLFIAASGTRCPVKQSFHECKGQNICLREDRTVATRTCSFAGGLTFSASPLQPNELFLVEIVKNDYGWSGSLRVGITETDPAARKVLPRFALPDLMAEGSSWVYTLDRSEVDSELGNNLILPESKFHRHLRDNPWGACVNFDALLPRQAPSFNRTPIHSRKNSCNDEFHARLGDTLANVLPESEKCEEATSEGSRAGVFYSLEDHDLALLYFVVNGECRGPFPFELQGNPLFVVCDVYGCTNTIRIVPLYEVSTLRTLCRDAILNTAQKLNHLPLPHQLIRYLKYQ